MNKMRQIYNINIFSQQTQEHEQKLKRNSATLQTYSNGTYLQNQLCNLLLTS